MWMAQAPFLRYAAALRAKVEVPVIAVGRLGNPALAAAAIAEGKADFIALGRSLVADPDWVNKVAAGRPVRRCLSCNTCVDEMRTGARIGCVVNPAAGRERELAGATPPQGEKIAVVGAGPAGLTYALAVAAGNAVTVFERAPTAGGAFRLAGRAPLFQNVEAREEALLDYVESMVAACRSAGVAMQFGVDPTASPAMLDAFDRVAYATGATYRLGLEPLVRAALTSGAARLPGLRQALSRPGLREWFYRRARRGRAAPAPARPGQIVHLIGDARLPGKSKEAIADACAAALRRAA
ncbi:MAG: NAD(P)-binding protein, partial [Rhodospirillales bacterium]|nr:NAD(P)-binding protein [Rhodospirillales bacterium]